MGQVHSKSVINIVPCIPFFPPRPRSRGVCLGASTSLLCLWLPPPLRPLLSFFLDFRPLAHACGGARWVARFRGCLESLRRSACAQGDFGGVSGPHAQPSLPMSRACKLGSASINIRATSAKLSLRSQRAVRKAREIVKSRHTIGCQDRALSRQALFVIILAASTPADRETQDRTKQRRTVEWVVVLS